MHLPNFAMACDRRKTTDREAAELASTLLYDVNKEFQLGIPDEALIIDRNKVRRERNRVRSILVNDVFDETTTWGLYFDGKRDKTLVNEKNDETKRFHRKIKVEDHVTLLREPDSTYICHVTPTSGHGQVVCNAIHEKLIELGAPLQNLFAVGCDGTVANTGSDNGTIALLEKKLNRPVHWFVCLLHLNELPLRNIIEKLYGVSKGPETFCGVQNKPLRQCETMKIVQFDKIATEVPCVDEKIKDDLSTDQNYLLEIALAVSKGTVPIKLANRSPGNMSLARWLTTAARFLRLYVSTENPNANLKMVVTFIMKVYVPSWFAIHVKRSTIVNSYSPFEVSSFYSANTPW